MKKIVKSAKIKGENELLNQSHYFAIFYGGSNLFPALRIEDITSGIRYYRFLCEIDAQLEQDAAPVIAKLKKTADLLFTQRNLEVALGCEESERAVVQTKIDTFRQKLPAKEQKHFVYNFDLKPERAAFANAGGVLYNTTSLSIWNISGIRCAYKAARMAVAVSLCGAVSVIFIPTETPD